jgi:hypothetical protein
LFRAAIKKVQYLTNGAGLESKGSELEFDLTVPSGAEIEDRTRIS